MKYLIVFFLICLTFIECENNTKVYINPYFVIREISQYDVINENAMKENGIDLKDIYYKCEGPLGNIIIYSDQKYLVGDTLILTQKFTKTKQ